MANEEYASRVRKTFDGVWDEYAAERVREILPDATREQIEALKEPATSYALGIHEKLATDPVLLAMIRSAMAELAANADRPENMTSIFEKRGT
jgi:hypothetical protein